ncbi:BetA, Choline dehydrogenase and related flavoprotein [Neofusicoccum parvum]|uniref:BetA, Choline dehydrogenase and related flavoprotein n=1 Tax=Neofusicoccum parvum TaxID=310453 RepID=A0ACB5S029_9PEZI|nr:BetA, Choline dehydrogenase and related flavoprotein [Neofusicoccum parvum]
MRRIPLLSTLFTLSTLSLSAPILDPITNPYLSTLASLLSGKGLVQGTLGALAGAAGLEATYDYVVVGGGTAGNAIGTRLAAAGHSVAIVEAGGHYQLGKPVLGSTPAGGIVGIGANPVDSNPLVDWVFTTEPQKGAAGREVHYARGKCLGGSSALNFLIYQRGSEQSYQRWAEMVGDDSYTLANLLPYFERAVSFTPPDDSKRLANVTSEYEADAFASPGGPVHVGYSNYVSPFATWLEKALLADGGLNKTAGFNSGRLLGTHYAMTTLRADDQTRSASDAYINAALENENLRVYTNTMAKKVLFDGNKTATGVRVESAGVTYDIHATKEVILSAGAFQSPQLLMVSGVGPRETLEKFDIEVLSELPGVGQNMWDHILFGPSYEVNMDTLDRVLHDPLVLANALVDYSTKASGPLTSNVAEFLAWEKLPAKYRANLSQSTLDALSAFPADWPEVELISGNGYIGTFDFPVLQQPLDGRQYATVLGGMVAPTSRGSVTIASADASAPPLVDPNWLATPADQEVAVALYRRLRDVWGAATMREEVVTRRDGAGYEFWPGLEHAQSDAEILDVVRRSVMSFWHAAGTCRMGRRGEGRSGVVVDARARVLGVAGLRVVDASVMPVLPPGHPQSTVYAVAEKIADDVIKGR